jgi:DNA-binding transcriptional ArsR family regulator
MRADPDLASVAGLIGDPSRAAMLAALLGGLSLPAGELARCAGISPQTASGHLARLVDGGLLRATTRGRHRYYQLHSPEVGRALEALAAIAPRARIRSLNESEAGRALRFARTCYDHLAGALGVALTQRLVERELLAEAGESYLVTAAGEDWLAGWGIDLGRLRQGRRAFARPCLDWSQRRPHLAGALGAAITGSLFERGWIAPSASSRAVRLTEAGRAGLRRELDLDGAACAAEPG